MPYLKITGVVLVHFNIVNKQYHINMNKSSVNIKISKTPMSELVQSEEFLCRLLRPLLKTDLPLMKNLLKPLAKSVLMPLG